MDAYRAEQAEARLGSVLDARWTIEALLGIGGMAAVYAARSGDERMAIKVLHPDLVRSQRALDRFRRESDVLRTAIHPAVPRVHDSGTTADGSPYLVMDLLPGETVEARRRRFGGRLPWAEVIQIADVVLAVLAAAHARGLLHRDIKPSNVLWLDDGSVRVIDFGIARATREDEPRTRTGELPGSLPFMSPEHALGVPDEIDERSDLWSLGATMFLLLSGRPVHESPTDVGALAQAASKPAPSLGAVATGLPAALIAVVDRALAFDRRRRFADAAEMRAALAAEARPRVGAPRWRYLVGAGLVAGGILAWGLRAAPIPATAPLRVAPPEIPAPPPSPVAIASAAPIVEPAVPSVEPARPAPRRPSAIASVVPVASARCDPPFVIDPVTGTRRVKPGC